jgi:16S rRNA (guanine527-N7)-methyltransferase
MTSSETGIPVHPLGLLAGHLRRRDGHLLAMKGTLPGAELAALPAGWRVAAIGRLEVPGLAAERHAVLLSGPHEDGSG